MKRCPTCDVRLILDKLCPKCNYSADCAHCERVYGPPKTS